MQVGSFQRFSAVAWDVRVNHVVIEKKWRSVIYRHISAENVTVLKEDFEYKRTKTLSPISSPKNWKNRKKQCNQTETMTLFKLLEKRCVPAGARKPFAYNSNLHKLQFWCQSMLKTVIDDISTSRFWSSWLSLVLFHFHLYRFTPLRLITMPKIQKSKS